MATVTINSISVKPRERRRAAQGDRDRGADALPGQHRGEGAGAPGQPHDEGGVLLMTPPSREHPRPHTPVGRSMNTVATPSSRSSAAAVRRTPAVSVA